MGKERFRLYKQVKTEQENIARKGRKRGLWSSIGATLGGLLAMGITGGAAAPAVAALAAGAGTYIGGKVGDIAAKKGWFGTEKAKIKDEGLFFQGQRDSLVGQLTDQIGARAVKSVLSTALSKFGTSIMKTSGSGGVEVSAKGGKIGGFKFKDLFKSAAKDPDKALAGQKGLGKLLDFRGSFIGEKLSAAKSASLAKDFAEKGWIDPTLTSSISGKPIVAMDRALHEGQKRVAEARKLAASSVSPITSSSIRGLSTDDWAKASSFEYGDPTQVVPRDPIQSPTTGGKLSSIEQSWKQHVESGNYQTPVSPLSYPEVGVEGPPELIGASEFATAWEGQGQKLITERGKSGEVKAIFGDPGTPDVGMPSLTEDDYLIKGEQLIDDLDLTKFDEASWESGKAELQQLDRSLAEQQYWGRATPATEALSDEPTGMGEKNWMDPQSFSPRYNFAKPIGRGTRNLQRDLRWQNRLFGDR